MSIKKFLPLFLFCSFGSLLPAFAMERNDIDDIKSWLPTLHHDKAEEVLRLVNSEKPLVVEKNEGDWNSDYGYSFPGVNATQQDCLERIRERHLADGVRPDVIDLGAGHGLMSWKILVAGGRLVAIEKQEPTAKALQQKMRQCVPYLSTGEKVKDLCTARIGDVLKYPQTIYKSSFYDMTWSGNIIHLFTPEEATAHVKNLYKITKPDGYAYATVHSPFGQQDMMRYFTEQKKANNAFPGFFVMNRIHHYRYDASKKINSCTKVERVEPFIPAPQNMSPINVIDGFYQSQEKAEFDHDYNGRGTYKLRCHSAAHVFDPESLSYIFREAKFEIEEAFFMDNRGKKVTQYPSNDTKSVFGVGIIAHKLAKS